MTDKNQNSPSGPTVKNDNSENRTTVPSGKRKFVEPEISQPVEVLEATTFFQAVDSGATN